MGAHTLAGKSAKSGWQLFDMFTLLGANLFTLVMFALSGGSIMQTLWIYCIQAVIVTLLYYRRISKIRLLELAYVKKHKPKKAQSLEVATHYQIPHEQFAYLFIGFLPLIIVIMFIASIAAGDTQISINGHIEGTININEIPANLVAVIAAGFGFFIHHYLEYRHDCYRASHGFYIGNRYNTFRLGFQRMAILWFVVFTGPLLYFYFGSTIMFSSFIVFKTFIEIFPLVRRILLK